MNQQNLQRLTDKISWLPAVSSTDRPILGLVHGSHGALMIDVGNSPAHAQLFLNELKRAELPTPNWAMLTHWHWDHVFGSAQIDVPTLASSETARILKRMAQLDWSDSALDQRVAEGTEIAFCRDMLRLELPDRTDLTLRVPEVVFSDMVALDLGGVVCEIMHVGGDHAHDSSIVHVVQEHAVFLGDCIYDDLHHGPRRLSAERIVPLFERILAFEANSYFASHHDAPMSRTELEHEYRLISTTAEVVSQIGDDREAVLRALTTAFGGTPEEDVFEIADALLAGIRLPHVESVM